MHIVIATVGTRGDAQPYVALGKALIQHGHRVTMATHEDHRELAESHGLGFRPVCGNFRELMASDAGRRWLESGASIGRYLETLRETFEPLAVSWLEDMEHGIEGADGVLVHCVAAGAIVALQHRKIPYAVLSPFGSIPSGEFSVGVPRIPLITAWLNRAAFGYFLDQLWRVGDVPVRAFLEARGIAATKTPLWRVQLERGVGHLHLFSPSVVAKPKDWPAHAEVTGYCFLDAPASWSPPRSLVDFLGAEKEPPIYIGFGSMTGIEPAELAVLTREALAKAKRRAVIGMGWGGMKGFESSDDVMLLEDVPHDWLFPRVAAVVHHCGAGTTAAALRAGRPSVGVPFFGDQPFWAQRLADLGAAPPPVPKKRLTATRLAAAIERATTESSFAERAEALGVLVRAESGAETAATRAIDYLTR